MSGPSQYQRTRSEVIFRHVREVVPYPVPWRTYAINVVEKYHERTPAQLRVVHFKVDGDAVAAADQNAKKLSRYMDPLVDARLPADLEEAMVEALPEPQRSTCLRELAARYGTLAVQVPTGNHKADCDAVAHYMRECSDPIPLAAQMIADGRIDASDRAVAEKLIVQLEESMTAAATLIAQIKARAFWG